MRLEDRWQGSLLAVAMAVGLALLLFALKPSRGGSAIPAPSVPAGTEVTVRLLRPVSSRTIHLGDRFAGQLTSVDPPYNTLLPGGAEVEGRCVAARSATPSRPGYLRLVLSAIRIPSGRLVSLHTTTLIERGSAPLVDVQLDTSVPLRFTLLEPVLIPPR
jgi:hypothetical protein